jgi:hypothetical protein
VDGASSTNIWLPHLNLAYVPALESIETVNIVTNSFDAEQGLAGGAAVASRSNPARTTFTAPPSWYHDNSAAPCAKLLPARQSGQSQAGL